MFHTIILSPNLTKYFVNVQIRARQEAHERQQRQQVIML